MSENQENPNSYESAITHIQEVYEEFIREMNEVLEKLRAGRSISYLDHHNVSRLAQGLGADVCLLARPAPDFIDDASTPLIEAPADPYVSSSFQRYINDVIHDLVVDESLDPALLEGETVEYSFMYTEVEKVYRSGSRNANIPAALVDHLDDHDENLLNRIICRIEEDGDTYDTFSPEIYDGDVIDSGVEYEKVDKNDEGV